MKTLNIYNSLTKQTERFKPNTEGKVSMYTCGPTVYHYAHIGNLRSYIMEDILEKYIRYIGYDMTRVMNITDVGHLASDADTGDDKMLTGAKRENKSIMEIAKFYTDAFFEDCRKLNIKTPDIVEPATNCIDVYIRMITKLIQTNHAYVNGGNVYFDTSKLSEYHVFNRQNEDELTVGARENVTEDPNKKNKTDFVLWFTKSKFDDQELKWDSPWGSGYPGWHIECSGISIKHLGETLDIHCGGIDSVFPHHTNEIAQSEAYLGHKWCNYWFHIHHLNDLSGKMSKSKGGFLTLSLLQEKGYDPIVYRFFCLQSHYRKPLVFSYEALDNTVNAYNKLIKKIQSLNANESQQLDSAAIAKAEGWFEEALGNDLNTSLGISVLYDVLKMDTNDKTKLTLITRFDHVLSLDLLKKEEKTNEESIDKEFTAYIDQRIRDRTAAKKAKDFAKADAIREELSQKGILIKDTREGTVWEFDG